MAVEPRRGPLQTYIWKSESDAGLVSTGATYEGRFGMKLSLFTDMKLKSLTGPRMETGTAYEGEALVFQFYIDFIFPPHRILTWWPIKSFITSFNEHRVEHETGNVTF